MTRRHAACIGIRPGAGDARTSEEILATSSAGHEFIDHTSEMVVRLHAPDFGELIAEAARAFSSLAPQGLRRESDPEEARELRIEPTDRPRMLVDWLNELVFLAEAECWLPDRLRVREEDGGGLVVEAVGARLDRPFVLVKAATLHDLRFEDDANGIEAEVTLDV